MSTLALLEAVDRRDVQTPADIAAALGVDEADAARQLSDAENGGLVAIEEGGERQAMSGSPGRFLRLTDAGRAEIARLRGGQHQA